MRTFFSSYLLLLKSKLSDHKRLGVLTFSKKTDDQYLRPHTRRQRRRLEGAMRYQNCLINYWLY